MAENKSPKGLDRENSSNSIQEGETLMSSVEKKQKGLTRRDFVKGAAAGAVGGVVAGAAGTALSAPKAQPKSGLPAKWNYVADIVIVGAGCTGLPAAIEAAERGASVIAIDQNFDVGGYGLISSGSVLTGGGTKQQKENGIEDSADLRYNDLIDHTYSMTKKNDRAMARAFADLCKDTTEWLEKYGAKFVLNSGYFPPYTYGSVERGHAAQWKEPDQTAKCPNTQMMWAGTSLRDMEISKIARVIASTGAGLIRPLEDAARKMQGVQFLLEHKLTRIIREKHLEGAVIGIEAVSKDRKVYLKGRKGVIIAAGGPKGNIQLRRLWDPRITEIYQASGEPWAFHSGEGIIEAQKIGAQLTGDYGNDIHWLHMRSSFGARWHSISPYISKLRSGQDRTGFPVRNVQDVIHVNTEGKRFYNEAPTSWDKQVPYVDAAMAKGGGPIWCIFDSDAVKRERWDPAFPTVEPDYFYSADTIANLAVKIGAPASALEETVTKYNSYVDLGKDPEFGKPTPKFKIQTSPFYAAWATPYLHDTRGGLRVNGKWQVLDVQGVVIPGLYAGGEAAGGLDLCGLAKSIVSGRIAARNAALEKPRG